MKSEEYKKYKEEFCHAFNAKRLENVFEISQHELRSQVGNIPKSFFRYRAINEYTDGEVISGNIHLSHPYDFDDIFDSKCYIDENAVGDAVVSNYLNSRTIAKDIPEFVPIVEKQEKYFETVNIEINKRLRIACFTQKNDNIPMWYYYADKHKGICIEYDFSKLKSFSELGYIFLPVIYPNKNETNNYYTGIFIENTFDISAVRNSLVKSNDWKFEKEWRVIKINDESDISIPIKSIYLGYEISDEYRKHILQLIEASGKKISVYNMVETVTGLKPEKID